MPTHESTIRHQQASLLRAKNHREPWMATEVEALREGQAAEVAEALGRTVYAVQAARHQLAKGLTLGGGNGAHQAGSHLTVKVCDCHGLQVLPSGACALD